MVPRQQQRRRDDERLARIESTIRELEKTLMRSHDHPSVVRPGQDSGIWELTRSGLGIITGVASVITIIVSIAVAWTTSQNALVRKLDRSDFVKDSIAVASDQRDARLAIERQLQAQLDFQREVLQRLREICVGVRTGCR